MSTAATLRRRMNILQRAQNSLVSGANSTTLPSPLCDESKDSDRRNLSETSGDGVGLGLGDIRHMEYFEGDSETEDSRSISTSQAMDGSPEVEEANDDDTAPDGPILVDSPENVSPTTGTSKLKRKSSLHAPRGSESILHGPATTRAWYEIDLAVIVALISPLGNWLTGGDYVKNALMVLFLIFYLHQIIEIPWTLYQNARPRRPSIASPIQLSKTEDIAVANASTQLHHLELLFLSLSLLSPIFGSLLLHIVLGPEALTWFSTTLFVLSTGIRPWKHLISRLSQRTDTLHDIVHYPNEAMQDMSRRDEHSEQENDARKAEIEVVIQKMGDLEQAMDRLRKRTREDKEDLYEYMDDAIEGVERNLKRWMDKAEEDFGNTSQAKAKLTQLQTNPAALQPPSMGSLVQHYLPGVFRFLRTLQKNYGFKRPFGITLSPSPPKSPVISLIQLGKQRSRDGQSARLETIMEAEENGASILTSAAPLTSSTHHRTRKERRNRFTSLLFWIPGSMFVVRLGWLLSLPLRSVWSLLFGRTFSKKSRTIAFDGTASNINESPGRPLRPSCVKTVAT